MTGPALPRPSLAALRRALSAALLALALAGGFSPGLAGQEPPEGPSNPPETPAPDAGVPPLSPSPPPESGTTPSEEQVSPPATAPPPEPGAAAAPVAPAGPPADQLDFELTFPPDEKGEGGGSAAGSAATLDYRRDDYAVLAGSVHLKYQDLELSADRAELDLTTKVVTATGNVVLDQGPRRLTGETLTFDLDTKTGTLTEASGQVTPDYYFRGREVTKTGDDTYEVVDGTFTSCSQKVPDWSFRLGRARVEVGGYAHVRNATLRAKRLPLIYAPYILWPVKSERSSGLLVPNFGYSEQRGTLLGLAYYQTLGRSYDTTFHVDAYSAGFLGLGNEFRYRPTEGTRGQFVGYAVRDPDLDEWRWKVDLRHTSDDLPWDLRGGINYQDFSDFDFFKDFERDFDRNTQRFIYSRGFVSKNSGPHLFNAQVDQREVLVGVNQAGENVTLRRLPEIDYRLRSTRLGRTRLYLQAENSISYLDSSELGSYGRVDFFPQLRLPLLTIPWLSFTLNGGERITWWGDSLDPADRSRLSGESLTRTLSSGGAELVGPSFTRIFDFGADKLKHVIEPRFTYSYSDDFDEAFLAPRFDEIDFSASSTNFGRAVLSNRFLLKRGAIGSSGGSSGEVVLFELARNFSFDELQPLESSGDGQTTTSGGPLEARLRFTPSRRTNLEARAFYSLLFDAIASTELTGNLGISDNNNLRLSYITRNQAERGETLSDQLSFSAGVEVVPKRLLLQGEIFYDLKDQGLQQQRYVLNYIAQCYGVRFEFRDFRAGVGNRRRDKDIRFAVTLKNVGTFLDLTGRSSTDGQ